MRTVGYDTHSWTLEGTPKSAFETLAETLVVRAVSKRSPADPARCYWCKADGDSYGGDTSCCRKAHRRSGSTCKTRRALHANQQALTVLVDLSDTSGIRRHRRGSERP